MKLSFKDIRFKINRAFKKAKGRFLFRTKESTNRDNAQHSDKFSQMRKDIVDGYGIEWKKATEIAERILSFDFDPNFDIDFDLQIFDDYGTP